MDERERARRQRVVHGWKHDPSVSVEEGTQIRAYLSGASDVPPKRWAQIDKVMR